MSRALLVLAGIAAVSASVAPDRATAAAAAARVASGAVMFVVIEQLCVRDERLGARLYKAAAVSAVIPTAVALYQWSHDERGFVDRSGFSRISGTFVHPDSFATYLALVLVVLAVAAFTMPRHRGLLLLAAAPVTCVLVLTYSRGGWISIAVAALYLTWRRNKFMLVPVVALFAILVATVPAIGARLTDLSTSSTGAQAPANSLEWREYYWRHTARYFFEHPIAGVGLDNVQRLEPQAAEPHNVVVQAGAEMGVLGLAALAAVVVAAGRLLRRARLLLGPRRRIVLMGIGASLVLAVQALATNLLTEALLYWYWAALTAPLAAAVVAAERRARPTADAGARR